MKYKKVSIKIGNTIFSVYTCDSKLVGLYNIRFESPPFNARYDFLGRWLRFKLYYITASITHKDNKWGSRRLDKNDRNTR